MHCLLNKSNLRHTYFFISNTLSLDCCTMVNVPIAIGSCVLQWIWMVYANTCKSKSFLARQNLLVCLFLISSLSLFGLFLICLCQCLLVCLIFSFNLSGLTFLCNRNTLHSVDPVFMRELCVCVSGVRLVI